MLALDAIETMYDLTWEELIHLEPRLDALLSDVRSARPAPNTRDDFDYELEWGTFKNDIASLVGYFRRGKCDPRLKTEAAYKLVYSTLWHALHD